MCLIYLENKTENSIKILIFFKSYDDLNLHKHHQPMHIAIEIHWKKNHRIIKYLKDVAMMWC